MRKKEKDALYMVLSLKEMLHGKHDMFLINYQFISLFLL